MHPFGQIVEVLPVALPFELIVEGLVDAALRELFANTKAARRGVLLPCRFFEPAQPSGARIVGAMLAQGVVHLIDESKSKVSVTVLPGASRKPEDVANREGVGPEVTFRRLGRSEPGPVRKARHELGCDPLALGVRR
jgi:hypothetical protein